ncbi:MAG: ABC transporter permease [Oscillospiraceae bacterium]|nr:ABC transporter permease [Oscillospiraceae bacterium]
MKKFKRILIIAANALCLIGILAGALAFRSIRATQTSQLAYRRWQGESDGHFAQVSVFAPKDAALSAGNVQSFRGTIDAKLAEAGVLLPETGSLWRDAYCAVGSASLSTARGSATALSYGIGGDYFLFHPLLLLSGQYLKPDDLTDDRVVVSEQLAWKLYGGTDLAGMSVRVNGADCIIAGVVRMESDFAAERALGEETQIVFMPYSRFAGGGEPASDITCYELVMPEPLTGYAEQLVRGGLGSGKGVLTMENSTRFTAGGVWKTLKSFGDRVMRTTPVVLPYWENAARYSETLLSGILLLAALLCVLPAVTLVWLIVKGWILAKKAVKSGVHKMGEAIESGRERRWERSEAKKHAAAEKAPSEAEPSEAPAESEAQDEALQEVNRVVREIMQEKK